MAIKQILLRENFHYERYKICNIVARCLPIIIRFEILLTCHYIVRETLLNIIKTYKLVMIKQMAVNIW